MGSARRAGGGSSAATRQQGFGRAGRSREKTAAIREWAKANGHDVSDRGRIPSAVVAAYASRGQAPVVPAVVAAPAVEAEMATEADVATEVEVAAEAEVKPKRRSRKKSAAAS